jgi:3-deoxy-D-manno-octulosonate 8-phosphate phosphatase (KDO 8-P phosphatase)
MSTAEKKGSKIKLLFLDVDGVMTDGRFGLSDEGVEIKFFHVRDGLGLKMIISEGIEVVLITGRRSRALEIRAGELGIDEIYQGVKEKGKLCREIMKKKGLGRVETCSMGDDFPDLEMFRETGLSIAVADAVKEIREASDFITRNRGGHGAVREACEWLLRCRE